MANVETVVSDHFPEVLDPLKAALAVAAVGCFSDNAQPTTLVLVGRSGAGKSMALNFLMPKGEGDELAKYIYRSDKLTAASFVSQRADLTREQLKEVDLLPRIRGKTMVSKELAPLLRGQARRAAGAFFQCGLRARRYRLHRRLRGTRTSGLRRAHQLSRGIRRSSRKCP
jgi:ABC-type glutathione transport system ATPase component